MLLNLDITKTSLHFQGKSNPRIPLIVLGISAIIGGIVSLLLPETLNRDLPQTIQDGEDFGKDQNFCYFPCVKLVSILTVYCLCN